jgi:hypothetical protein
LYRSNAKRMLCIALFLLGINYYFAAHARAHAGETTGGWEVEISDTHDGAYTARYALINRRDILLRLYRTGDPTVLAERTYDEHGVALTWTKDMLIYDSSVDDGVIDLPPTRMDRLLAMLP